MTPILRLTAVLCCCVTFVRCDQRSDTSPPPAPSATPAPESAGVGSVPTFSFSDDGAFARFAASLEPDARRIDDVKYVYSGQLVAQGTRAVGHRHFKANYVYWTVDPQTGKARADFVDQALGEPEDETLDFSSSAWKSRAAPDGTWGCFVWPQGDSKLRPELWRLPLKPGEKAERFHVFAVEAENQIDRPSISPDGRWLFCRVGGKPALFAVDAPAGKVRQVALSLPPEVMTSDTQRVFLQLAGHGLKLAIDRVSGFDKAIGGSRRELGLATIEVAGDGTTAKLSTVQWLPGNKKDTLGVVAMSPDGELLLVRAYSSATDEPARIWRWPKGGDKEPALVTALPRTSDRSSVVADWSADGRLLAVVFENTLEVFKTENLATGQPDQSIELPAFSTDVSFAGDGLRVIVVSRGGLITSVPLGQPREVAATIGESRITWTIPGQAPTIDRWPALRATASIKHPEGDVPPTLIADVSNVGSGAAEQVRATFVVAPPYAPLMPDGSPGAPVSQLSTLHFGSVREGLNIRRFVDLPRDESLFGKARRFSLIVRGKFDFDPAPIHWLHLPRTVRDEAEYHVLARKIFDAAGAALVKANGVAWKEPKFMVMGAEGFGFMVSYPRTVIYQNPFQMSEDALRVNRAVMQVDTKDDLMRHAQMMLFWYLPHELVHCADNRTGWATEFVANMIQPYLTARMLDAMPDAPYSAESMAYIYDRYVEKLRPHLSSEEIARIERFIQSDGKGQAPWDMSSSDLFRSNTPAYVYFGARINQHSWSRQTTLETLCKEYLPGVRGDGGKD